MLSALYRAKALVSKRVQSHQCTCTCTSHYRISFRSALIKNFGDRTLFHYLLNGDDKELDNFKVDVRINFSAFDIYDVLTAYHKLRRLKNELIMARNLIVVNPFLSLSDLDNTDSDCSL